MTPLTTEIRYWLKQLRIAEKHVQEHDNLVKEIVQYHKYSIPVNVYGHIEYAPRVNAFGVFIRRPEHVNYGWNIGKLRKQVKDLKGKIRDLRLEELEWIRDGSV